ncbi:histidine phosphatase family protein [Ktedonosporobacter rubrisoli]|uniref:Histidine phosphatase family protein n=1 Tax=Ktedonosporobacter rubrisoli TaxID=2509675 RepID=A0A4P6JUF0_KTERU|nr:histidine phosphatase family protein [Ktedonosporobacter rubrisoli]QBD79257.1 histidine phosphatase family protein [Ktedonosporobacter rubrisoli]
MDLILVRHGECGTSSTDDMLTARGEWQAQRIGQSLANEPVTALLSSPLLRALGTASIIAQRLGNCQVEVWTELREGFDGSHRGCGSLELRRHFPLAVLPPTIAPDGWEHGGDTQESMFERCRQILHALRQRFKPTDTIVVVTHGGMLTYLFHVLLQVSPRTPSWFEINYAALNRVRLVPDEQQKAYLPLYPRMAVEILSINDISHLS